VYSGQIATFDLSGSITTTAPNRPFVV